MSNDDDMWGPPPDPTRDRYSAWDGPPPPAPSPPPSPSPPPYRTPLPPPRIEPWKGQYASQAYVRPPSNHLVFGILTTLFCFLPFGVVSLVKGSSVNNLWAQGRYEEAYRASLSARNWAIAALVAVPVIFIGGGLILLLMFATF